MKGVAITVLSVSFVHAHQYAISTYAGVPPQPNASSGYFGLGLAVDAAENVYFSADEPSCSCVFKLDPRCRLPYRGQLPARFLGRRRTRRQRAAESAERPGG